MQGSSNLEEKLFTLNHNKGRKMPGYQGQTLLEFVLALPLILFVLLLIIQFGIGLYAQSIVTGAAQEGARVAAEADKAITDGIGTTNRLITGGLGSQVTVKVEGVDDGETVYIDVKAAVPTFLPFLDKVMKFDFHSRANMVKEGWKN